MSLSLWSNCLELYVCPGFVSCPVADNLCSSGLFEILSTKNPTESSLKKGGMLFFKELNNQVIAEAGASFWNSETLRTGIWVIPRASLSPPLLHLSVSLFLYNNFLLSHFLLLQTGFLCSAGACLLDPFFSSSLENLGKRSDWSTLGRALPVARSTVARRPNTT